MRNIMFLCSGYSSDTDANGICVRNVAAELKHRGYKIYILTESSKDEILYENKDEVIIGIKKPWLKRNLENSKNRSQIYILRIIHGIFALFVYPNVSPIRSAKVYRKAMQLIKKNDVDTVVCVYRPFESIHAGLKIKNKNHKVKVIGYHLDLLTESNTSSNLIGLYKRTLGMKAIKRELALFDKLIFPNSIKKKIKPDPRISFADFPLSVSQKPVIENAFRYNELYINISYIGSIDGENREIEYILQMIETYNHKYSKKIELHIWGNISDRTKRTISSSESVQYHGSVENKYTSYLLLHSDFTLNLSNIHTFNMIPSKIFELISLGKPIINIVEHEEDKALNYFSQIGYCLNILKKENSIEKACDKMRSFIVKYYENKCMIYPTVFRESTPEYTADIICE